MIVKPLLSVLLNTISYLNTNSVCERNSGVFEHYSIDSM